MKGEVKRNHRLVSGVCSVHVPSVPHHLLQRLGVYNQHASDQLELRETPVEYLRVRFSRYHRWFTSPIVPYVVFSNYLLFEMQIEDCSSVIRKTIILYWLYILYIVYQYQISTMRPKNAADTINTYVQNASLFLPH